MGDIASRLSTTSRLGVRKTLLVCRINQIFSSFAARSAIRGGRPVFQALHDAHASLRDGGFSRVDYFSLVDAATLEPLETPAGEMRLIAAAVIGTTRLIDNLSV